MVLLEFSISPMDKGESLSPYVSRILKYIDESNVSYKLTAMGTILEGQWDEVIAVVTGCFKLLEKDCNRISLNLKVDYRAGDNSRMESKIEKVEKTLNRKLST
ncbi:MAG: MTH1187 family thiamine-binding protein [Bacteroidota bacterium]|nr:MTH1187 family thiamine-binding protein [Bacteroidota bacterium]MDP4192409.1 MTH1187 family thiamine-binding protein [Bacteroidota bacterium]MDP4195161.1 MTH1187 family thiamine-binding protein [Bacteroidota bacterium]